VAPGAMGTTNQLGATMARMVAEKSAFGTRLCAAFALCAAVGCSGGGDVGGPPGPVVNSTSCDPDPMHTGATDRAGTDDYDCLLLEGTQKHAEPDAMIFKAIIRVESGFQVDAAGCPNAPCGTPAGWSVPETQCLGLMQIVPACSPKPGDPGLLSNGHPNMTLDQSSALFATSLFNPAVNIDIGIAGVAGNRAEVMKQFPGCTEEQYTLMAIGNYNQYGSTKGCTTYNVQYDNAVLQHYAMYVAASGWHPHPY
jgi:hypothetical protein